MKSYIVAICLVCTMLFPAIGHTSQPGDMYLRFLEGDVQVKTEDAAEWLPATINMPLIDGDQVWVPENGRAELMLRDGTVIRLDRNSYLEILTSEKELARFLFAYGRAYSATRIRKGDSILFETPVASFRAYEQSVFGIDLSENDDLTVSVFRGEIYADSGTGQMKINFGDKISFSKYTEYPRLNRIDPLDQWEQWNRRRDLEFGLSSPGLVTTYLPDELGSYSSDFERNGKWVYEPEYGYVWIPTVIIAKDWSPYRVGRWVWMRGDYVWISYEPWGWAPYHYGRWAFINHRGWCWVPPAKGDVYWGPGFVGWVYTPTYISWVPLAPREIYYGRGNYGPHSVNIRSANIPTVNVVYRNVRVNNAVTTIHHDTFVTGRSINGTIRENLFLREKRVMGSPDIRPERLTRMPVIKNIVQSNRPPQQIVNRVSDERERNKRSGQIQTQRNLPAGSTGRMTRTGQTIDRKNTVPQSSLNVPARVEQAPPAGNPNVITGPPEPREERATRSPGELRNNTPPQNNIKGTKSQQAAPVRAAIVPARKIEATERKIEILKKNPEASANEQKARIEIRQQQNPKPMENAKIASPVRSDSPAIISQQAAPENTEKIQATPKGQQITQQKASIENIKPEDNTKDRKKEARAEMQQRKR